MTEDEYVDMVQLLTAYREREIERLLVDNAELSAECDQWGEKVAACWREVEQLRTQLRDA